MTLGAPDRFAVIGCKRPDNPSRIPGRFEPEDKGCSLKASTEGQTYRLGYFLGDGTGAGKGRQAASVILDRSVRGERRHIWISKNEALLKDARRDWAALGGLPIDLQPLASWKLGTPVAMRDGILFVTYGAVFVTRCWVRWPGSGISD